MGNIGSNVPHKEEDLLDLLDIIILKMMLVEKLEDFQIHNHYNKQLIKNIELSKELGEELITLIINYKVKSRITFGFY